MKPDNHKQRLGRWFIVSWWAAFVMAAPLAARLLYERTVLMWRDGDQALGFALAHGNPVLLFLGLAGCVLLAVWFAVALIDMVARKKAPSGATLSYLLVPPLIGLICYPVF